MTERKVVSVIDGGVTVASRNVKSRSGQPRMLRYTQEWNLVSSRNADGSGLDYLPPLKYFEFPLYPGKGWRQISRETNVKTGATRDFTLSATVGEWENISVPADTFRAIKITSQTEIVDSVSGQRSTGTDVSWYAPDIRRSVRSVITSRNMQGDVEDQVIHVAQYQVNRGQAQKAVEAGSRPTVEGAGAGTDAGVAALSDAFTGSSLDPSWTVVNSWAVTLVAGGGSLTMTPTQGVLWSNTSRGVLVYKLVTGDFMVTTTAHAHKASAPTEPPDSGVHLGGLMARSPSSDSGQENYLFAAVGVGDQRGHLTVQTKNTLNGASVYEIPRWPSADAELRLCRTGSQFSLYKRTVGAGTWTLAATYKRADLPATLQVGPILSAPQKLDLRVTIDGVKFAPVSGDCTL